GNELWVAEGVYYATSSFNLKNGVEIYGGFAATETLRTERDWQTRPTVLSGDLGQDDIYTGTLYTASWADQRGANANHVVVANSVDDTARLDGFIVTAGAATSSFGGGGILNQSSSPGYYNLEVRGNRGPTYGGGMLNISSSPHLENVLFDSNRIDDSTSGYGGGMYDLFDSRPTLIQVTLNNNSAGWGGGYGSQGSPYLEDVTFSNNSVSGTGHGGGAYFHDDANVTMVRATFINNRAAMGGGLYAFNEGSLTMTDTTFIQNTTFDTGASNGDHGGGLAASVNININALNISFIGNDGECGGGVYLTNGSILNLRNGLFRGNSAGGGGGCARCMVAKSPLPM
ncbi:MAG: hypothetical protein KC415_20815, partial [Anaerolineales bacterium]|nr:hypothetical protein [Anaerolineales bacterium]